MIKALAPGMRRGCSWAWLSIALAGGFPATVLAQPAKDSGSAKKDVPAAKAAGADEAATEESPEETKTPRIEVFEDPRAKKALEVFKSVPGLKSFPNREIKEVAGTMAAGGSLDREKVQRFVNGMAYDLVDKANINGLINPPEGGRGGSAAKGVQRATDNLIEALATARQAKNSGFLSAYNEALLDTLPKLLDNNLVARVQAMIVLGQTGNPRAIPVFLKELKNPDQTIWVKLWALRGLTNVAENGTKVDAIGAQATEAGKTVADFLNKIEPDAPWPVQVRALEALGSMRQASMPNSMKAEMASTAMKFLADPEARPEVRAQAAWALGMLRVSQAVKNYNYPLVAYDAGLLAAELGEKINASFDTNRTLSEYLTGLLVTPIHQAFNGEDGARESGLLKVPGGHPGMNFMKEVANLTSAVSLASVELIRAPTGQIPGRKKTLGDRVAGLKTYLDKNAPKDYHLVPKGDEFRPLNPAVAKAADNKPRGGGANGR